MIKVKMLQEDIPIQLGYTRTTNCPLALAISRALGVSVNVSYFRDYEGEKLGEGYYRIGETNNRIPLPPIANEFLLNFDTHELVTPIEFEIEELKNEEGHQ